MYFHVASAHRTLGHLTGGNPAVLLFPQHGPDLRLIVIQSLMACLFALEQPVVSLGCKYTLVLKTGQPELVVHIGGQDKVVFILHHGIQIPVQLCRRHVVPVIINMAAPIGPLLLLGGKRIEPR